MDVFKDIIYRINKQEQRKRFIEILQWMYDNFTSLTPDVKWHQTIFTQQETFIIGFSVAKNILLLRQRLLLAFIFQMTLLKLRMTIRNN